MSDQAATKGSATNGRAPEDAGVAARFTRQTLTPGWRQDQLAASHVLIAGAGALGNVVAQILALAGVGRLTIVDPDVIEASNLSRGPLFTPVEVGREKAVVAAAALARLAPEARIEGRVGQFEDAVGLGEIADAALTMSCLDSRIARQSLASRMELVGAPSIDGGTNDWGGEVRMFPSRGAACYGCGLTPKQRVESDAPWSCADPVEEAPMASNAATSAIVGAWMAQTALRWLMAAGPVWTESWAVVIDPTGGVARRTALARDPACMLHAPLSPVAAISVSRADTVGALRAALGPGRMARTWRPIARESICMSCGYEDPPWLPARRGDCPRCGDRILLRTTTELSAAPEGASLAALGIAPEEIVSVRTPRAEGGGYSYVRLSPERTA